MSYAQSDAELRFDGEDDFDLHQYVVAAFLARKFGDRLTVQLTLGGILDGRLQGLGRSFDVEPGFLGAASLAYRFLGGPGQNLFGAATLGYGMSFASAREETAGADSVKLTASDLRIGAIFGVTLGQTVSPFLAARGFAGPVGWELDGEKRTGSDRHHYAVGPGIVVNLHERVDFTVDTSLVGERTLAVALAASF
ncbi:MAG: hypothetical protein R3B13_32730 [Polyangiaceae bacterium]